MVILEIIEEHKPILSLISLNQWCMTGFSEPCYGLSGLLKANKLHALANCHISQLLKDAQDVNYELVIGLFY